MVEASKVEVEYIPSNDNSVDMLTKALGTIKFKQGWTQFNMMSLEKIEKLF
jgi:hypothetical protein